MRSIRSTNFNSILWKDKIDFLRDLTIDFKSSHSFEYCHKDFHSGNILMGNILGTVITYISDFRLSGPADKQKSDDKIYGVLPYIAPEVLNGDHILKLLIFIVLV